jgi:hypothetical protein
MQRVLDWLDNLLSDAGEPPLPQKQKWVLFVVTAIVIIWILVTATTDIISRLQF